ncbi:hypothetical protein [Actinocrispum wychmicini]|uniref:Integral membrane protein n=1 Tax=Actinocrispum wychmicini TaxID=1213861 RepID=A0A4R2JA45_9PSEU|nr:hypothetical protein [Actinocrispum wychmicini]TCO52809.1 hypothetical protein EV192_1113 [Actinocrispum wychmicini]
MTTTIKRVAPIALWALRVAGVLFAVAVMGQAVFAGLFVTGDVGMLDMHGLNAAVVVVATLVWIVVAIILAVKYKNARELILIGVGALVITVVQMAVGGARILWLHIPLGVGMFALAVRMLGLAFSYGRERS